MICWNDQLLTALENKNTLVEIICNESLRMWTLPLGTVDINILTPNQVQTKLCLILITCSTLPLHYSGDTTSVKTFDPNILNPKHFAFLSDLFAAHPVCSGLWEFLVNRTWFTQIQQVIFQ